MSLVLVIQANSSVEKFLPKIDRLGKHGATAPAFLAKRAKSAVLAFDHASRRILLPLDADAG